MKAASKLQANGAQCVRAASFPSQGELLDSQRMGSSQGVKIAVGAGVALFAIVLYSRWGHREALDQAGTGSESAARSGQVEQRLQQLHEAHDRTSRQGNSAGAESAGGKIETRARIAPNPNRFPPSRGTTGQTAPAASNAPDTSNSDEANGDVDADDIPALKNIALKDSDPERRLAAVTMLGASEDPDVVPTLAQALSDKDDEVRMAAIQSLSDFTGDAPVDLLSTVVVNDPSADNRYEALQALSDIGGERAVAAMQKALNDPDEDVRSLAEGMLDMEDTYQDTAGAPTPAAQQPPAP
jgi:hypothetical protein